MLNITAFEPFSNRVNGTLIDHSGVELKLAGWFTEYRQPPSLQCSKYTTAINDHTVHGAYWSLALCQNLRCIAVE